MDIRASLGIIGDMSVIIEQEFAAIVRGELAERGWSLSELSRQSGITVANISNYLAGKTTPGADQMERILNTLGFVPHLSVIKSDKILAPSA